MNQNYLGFKATAPDMLQQWKENIAKELGRSAHSWKKELFLGFNKINSRPWRKRHPSWWGLETWSNRDEVCAKLGHRQRIQQVQEHLLPITHAPYLSKLLSVHLLLASFIAISIPSCWRDRCHQPGRPPVGLRPRLGAPQRIQIMGCRSTVQPQSLCAIRELPVAPLVRVT